MASGQEHGKMRLNFLDTSENKKAGHVDLNTVERSGGALAIPTGATRDAIPNSPAVPYASEKIVAEFISNATDIIESEESACEIPVLVRDGKAPYKVIGEDVLTFENGTGFTAAGTVDFTCTANKPQRISEWSAPTGKLYQLNPRSKSRLYIGDDA